MMNKIGIGFFAAFWVIVKSVSASAVHLTIANGSNDIALAGAEVLIGGMIANRRFFKRN